MGKSKIDQKKIEEKRKAIRLQFEEIRREGLVTCGCGRRQNVPNAFRCYHCGEFYCCNCGDSHFGKKPDHYIGASEFFWGREHKEMP